MKKLILIPVIAISINTKSGGIDNDLIDFRKELELIDNTIDWVKSKDIKRDMRARKNELIKKHFNVI